MRTTRASKPQTNRREAVIRLAKQTPEIALADFASLEAEKSLIAAILFNPEAFYDVAEMVQAGDFCDLKNLNVWYAFEALMTRGEAIDPLTVSDELSKVKAFNAYPAEDLMKLVTDYMVHPINAANVEEYARRVLQGAIRVRLMDATDKIRAAVRNRAIDIESVINTADVAILNASNRIQMKPSNMLSIASTFYDTLEHRMQAGQIPAVLTGFQHFDSMTGGLGKEETVIVAGSAGQGKTSFMLSTIYRMMLIGLRVVVFSLEMTQAQLMSRFLTMTTGIPPLTFKNMQFTDAQRSAYVKAIADISEWQLDIIDEYTALKPVEFQRRAMRLMAQAVPDVIFIDGLWLMQADEPTETRARDVASIMTKLVKFPKDHAVPLVVMHQYSQEVKNRKNKKPTLYDLSESAAVQRDAHMVLGLYRHSYHDKGVSSLDFDKTRMYVLKDRNGTNTGKVFDFTFDRERLVYEEMIR